MRARYCVRWSAWLRAAATLRGSRFRRSRAALRDEFPGVEIRKAALADESGRREFIHVVEQPGWSGLAARPTPAGGPAEALLVQCERLDDVLPDGVRPAFVKIDVEGAEALVLRAAEGRCAPTGR